MSVVQRPELSSVPAKRSYSSMFNVKHWRSCTRIPAGNLVSLMMIVFILKNQQTHRCRHNAKHNDTL